MKLEIILVTFYAVEPSKIKGKIVVRKTDRELQLIVKQQNQKIGTNVLQNPLRESGKVKNQFPLNHKVN